MVTLKTKEQSISNTYLIIRHKSDKLIFSLLAHIGILDKTMAPNMNDCAYM